MMAPNALPLVPLIRFSGFVWIIAVGLAAAKFGRGHRTTSAQGRT
jgi:hypothetical protein